MTRANAASRPRARNAFSCASIVARAAAGAPRPIVYVVGTEVPAPGGAGHALEVNVTEPDRLGDLGEARGALGGDAVRDRGRLPGAAHARVEMDLAEAGACVSRDHRLGARERFLRWQPLPGIRS